MRKIQLIVMLIAVVLPSYALGDVVQIDASRDTAIIDQFFDSNLGANDHVPVGQSNNSTVRRSLFFMDIEGFIPAGATINNVIFEFDVTQQGGFQGQQGADFGLHRLTTDWTEGTGFGPNGAATGDGATWNNATGSTFWTTPGGDFAGASSGSVFIDHVADGGGTITYSLGNAQLLADVQDMLNDASSNFGFALKAINENLPGSAMRVTSRENTDGLLGAEARLIVDFTPIPEPASAVVLCVLGLLGSTLRRR